VFNLNASLGEGRVRQLARPVVRLLLRDDLVDAAGGVNTPVFSRASATTRINTSTGLLEYLPGDRDQLIDVSAQSPDNTNSWWTEQRIEIGSGGALIGSADEDISHYIRRNSLMTTGKSYITSLLVKPAAKTRVRILCNTDDIRYANFDLSSGEVAYAQDCIGSITQDGEWFRCVVYCSSVSVDVTNALQIIPVVSSGQNYTGDGSTVDLYIKEIMLEELPSYPVANPSPSAFIESTSIPAEPAFESDGLRMLGANVTNIISYSEDFTEWTEVSFATADELVIGPDGTLNAWKVIDTGGAGSSRIQFSVGTPTNGDPYTASVFVKEGNAAGFRIGLNDTAMRAYGDYTWTNGVPVLTDSDNVNTIEIALASGWYRIVLQIPALTVAGAMRLLLYPTPAAYDPAPATQYTYFFGANFTNTAFLIPYIPSHGSETILAAESLSWAMTSKLLDIVDNSQGSATSIGTAVFDLVFGHNIEDVAVTSGFINFSPLAGSGLITHSVGLFGINDVSTFESFGYSYDYDIGDSIRIVFTWDSRIPSKQAFKKELGSWVATDVDTYRGEWGIGSGPNLIVGLQNQYPFYVKNIQIYDEVFTQSQIEKRF
jgi:hypothetical protein